MKSQLLIVLTFICFILISYNSSLCGGKENYRIETITIEDGLFVNYAHAIIQDSIGFIWMGSDYGLQNYDAFLFKQYLHDPSDSQSLRSNSVIDLFTDSKKNFWISTSGGLQRYQYQTDNFKSFFFRNEHQYTLPFDVYALAQDSSGSLYAGINFAPESLYLKHKYIPFEEYTNNGVFQFDPLNGKFTPFEFVNKILNNVPSKNIIKDITFDKNNLLWVALVPHGIFLFDLKNNSYKNYLSSSNNPATLSNNNVNDILVDSDGEVWISTEQGLNKYRPDNDSFIRYLQNPLNSNSLQRNNVLKVVENKYGELWVGYSSNYTGISRFNKQSEKFINYTENLFKKSRSLFIDNSGVVWLGSANRGINVIIEFPLKFSTHTIFKDNKSLLKGFAISSIFEDTKGNTWFDGYPGGLYKYDRKSGQYTFYKSVLNKPDNLGSDWIKDIYEDKQGFIWFCTANAINRLDPQKHSFKNYQPNRIDRNGFPAEQIRGFCVVNEIFWIITPIGDLIRFNPVNENFKTFHLGENMRDITSYKDGVLWISSNTGVHKFDLKKQKFETIHNFKTTRPSYYGLNILADTSGFIWFSGDYGLTVYDLEMETIKTISEKDGLLSNIITAMEFDNSGNLWISSKRGLTKYNPKTETFKNYGMGDGLRTYDFSFWSHYKNELGEIYFGSFEGFVVFHPDSIKESDFRPNVILTGIKINNEKFEITKNGSLKKSIFTTTEIVLEYNQNDISLTFASLDYTLPFRNFFSYMLENHDLEWQPASTRYRAEYTNLSPDDYVFKVKGSNSDGVWNENPTMLKIIILPPWWKTWWAYSIYILFALGLLYSLRRYELNRTQLKNQVKLDEVKLKEKEETEKIKSSFFANISHEFRTPLTLILGPAEKIEKNESLNPVKDAGIITRNSKRLLQLVNQLLDLSKLDSGKLKLESSPGNIVSFIKGHALSFESLSESRDIMIKFKSDKEFVEMYFDREKMVKILSNLLSNAFKFTPEGGNVIIAIAETLDDAVEIKIKNTGIGIAPKEVPKLFDRFYQVDSSQTKEYEGTGIGLALVKELVELHHGSITVDSEIGKWTEFKIKLPLGRVHLKDEEILATDETIDKEEILIEEEDYNLKAITESDAVPDETKTIILVVEDNYDMREYIKESLSDSYVVEEAVNGEQGVRIAERIIPDLIISDLMMPKMDGNELTRILKNDERTSHIPIILLTAKSGQENKLEGLQTGADDYLTKPFDLQELQVRVENLISIRKKLQEKFGKSEFLSKKTDKKLKSIDEKFLARVLEVIEKHLSEENFSIEECSSEVGMSRTHLHKKLKALVGKSPSQYVRTVRLYRAKQMIEEERGNISEVAYSVGFSSLAYFSKCFKDEFGYPPRDILS